MDHINKRVIILTLFFLGLVFIAFSQERKVINGCRNSSPSIEHGTFVPIKQDGTSHSYYPNGNIKEEAYFIKKCKGFLCIRKEWVENGTWKYYYENGAVRREETYIYGKLQFAKGFDLKGIQLK